MRIEYEPKVSKYFKDYQRLKKTIGNSLTVMVKLRIDQIQASENLLEYINAGIGKPHWLEGQLKNCLAVSLNKNYRLILRVDIDNKDASTLRVCNLVIVKGVEDYHGSKSNWLVP